ncbi:MAG: glycosyltransferase family 2 protein [Anaerolineaceae bacterium]|jgi:GT2 family glycosyltransferase|nr:MAG: glycosyltransferase family 2 protein [Anaerolineaceae bacterium]
MKISVIICTRNRFDDFAKTLPSIAAQTRLPDELVVVDSSDEKRLEGYLNSVELPFPARYFYTQPGLTLQRNHGIRESKGDLIFFFDDDVDLDVNYLAEVEKVFADDVKREIGAVGGKIVEPTSPSPRLKFERFAFCVLRFAFGVVGTHNGKFHPSGMPSHPRPNQPSGFIECLSGCCMAFRRDVFEKAAFDEHLARYGLMEDVDISKQTLDAGYKIYYQTSATLIHNESPMNRLNVQQWAEMSVVNYDYLFRKSWAYEKWRWLFYYWALIGLFAANFHSLKGLKGTLAGVKRIVGHAFSVTSR